MEPTEVIRGRRTVRDFRADDISQDKLDRVLEAVRWTPSWLNTQCWEVVVVRNHEQKKKLAGTVSEGNPAVPAMTKAPVVLVVCARRGISGFFDGKANTDKGDWFMFDTGLAVQNLCLEAYNQGMGTVTVGSFDAKRAAEIVKAPEDWSVVVLIPLGYPEKRPAPPERRPVSAFVQEETY